MRATVVGTNHLYQFGGALRSELQNLAFARLLRDSCKSQRVRSCAEEMSREALSLNDRTESTVEQVARELGLVHCYCDPSPQQQQVLGLHIERNAHALKQLEGWTEERIASGVVAEHRVRERFWLRRLQELNTWPCLFVCGSEHALAFRSLLQDSGVEAHLLAENWDA